MNPESGYITAQIVSFSAMLQGMTLGAQGCGDLDLKPSIYHQNVINMSSK